MAFRKKRTKNDFMDGDMVVYTPFTECSLLAKILSREENEVIIEVVTREKQEVVLTKKRVPYSEVLPMNLVKNKFQENGRRKR